jgi:nucleotide-binding universal stress UspA family protein
MFNKILLPTDGSKHALKSAKIALKLAKELNAQVEILNVVAMPEKTILLELIPNFNEIEFEKQFRNIGRDIVALTAAVFEQAGVSYTTRVELGDPAETICQIIEQDEVDLVIIGSRGQSLSRFVMGSVSIKVAQCSTCPVMFVR